MAMDWILVLALATFAILVAFLLWTRTSTIRHHQTGGKTSGLGGPNDPLSGAAEGMRHPDEMRHDLDRAAAGPGVKDPASQPPAQR
jgi:hypothetical protein